MRKIILVLFTLLSISVSIAQNKKALDLPVAKMYLKMLKEQKVETSEERKIIIEEIKLKVLPNKDPELQKEALLYMKYLNSRKLIVPIDFNDSDVDLFEKKKFRVSKDDFNKSIKIKYKKLVLSPVEPFLYVVKNKLYPTITFYYSGKDWLFMDSVKFLINETTYNIKLEDVSRDTYLGGVTERSTFYIKDELMDILQKINESTELVRIRFSGERYQDVTLKKQQVEGIKEILKKLDELKK